MTDAIKRLRVVVFQEGEGWIAQCVDYDICAQGKDLAQVHRRMVVALREEAKLSLDETGVEFGGIDSAPDYFAAMYEGTCESLAGDIDIRIAA